MPSQQVMDALLHLPRSSEQHGTGLLQQVRREFSTGQWSQSTEAFVDSLEGIARGDEAHGYGVKRTLQRDIAHGDWSRATLHFFLVLLGARVP